MIHTTQQTRKRKKYTSTRDKVLMVGCVLLFILLCFLLFRVILYQDMGDYTVLKNPFLYGDVILNVPSDNTSFGTSGTNSLTSGDGSSDGTSQTSQQEDLSRFTYEAQNFSTDLSAYEMYMNPEGDEYLLLVNVENPLTADDIPSDLVAVSSTRQDGRSTQKMRLYAAKALEALFQEANAAGMLYENDGYTLSVTSAYRSYAYQKQIFEGYVESTMNSNPSLSRDEAEAKVMTYSCRPGTSEHQSGLCADLHNFAAASVSNGMREAFAESDAGQWLLNNCYKFGFVLRFPADKTDMTGIDYESWHFRYVGRYHATRMTEMNLCLEEYVEYLKAANVG